MMLAARCLITMAFALCASVAAQAEEDHVGPPAAECKEVAERLIEATGAEIDRWTPSGYRVFLNRPRCCLIATRTIPSTGDFKWHLKQPTFLPMLGSEKWRRLGALTGVDIQEVEASTRQCYRAALDSETRNASKDLPNNKIVECSGTFLKNGYETVKFYSEDD